MRRPGQLRRAGDISAGRVSSRVTAVAACGPALVTRIEYLTIPPARTSSLSSVLEILRSALGGGCTLTVATASLLAMSGSSVSDETVALFLRLPLASGATLTSRVSVVLSPPPIVPRWHLIRRPSQLPLAGDVRSGRVSSRVTAVAGSGPRLVTLIV